MHPPRLHSFPTPTSLARPHLSLTTTNPINPINPPQETIRVTPLMVRVGVEGKETIREEGLVE